MLLCAVTTAAWLQRRARPWLLVGWLWFLIALLPNMGVLQAGRQSIADRFTHLAMLGVVIAGAWSVANWIRTHDRWRTPAVAAAGGILVFLVMFTVRQIGVWNNSVTLFEHAIAVEDNDYIRGNLGTFLLNEAHYKEAERHLRAAVALAPDRWEHHNNRLTYS